MSPRKHKFIGVPTSLFLHNTTLIKQELLLFDEIVFTDPGYLDDNLTPELELLIDKGLISAADLVPNLEKSKSYQETYELLGDAIRQCCDEWRKGQLERLARGYTSFNVWSLPCTHLMDEYATRLF
ncbi:MAG: hypothetical protein CVU57_14405 [Deltaproteobacteria bacterium HGW-Deltaproteobacteria-15]|jgi:hypothetical protein|nr:MAG: hypothetical protein CVU57_14405 [Deltaproteobacteria bacterium HGW-Deltaproteobacteria-15]